MPLEKLNPMAVLDATAISQRSANFVVGHDNFTSSAFLRVIMH